MSPSSRRAWVEIPVDLCAALGAVVALLTEGVGRNWTDINDATGTFVALLTEGVGRNRPSPHIWLTSRPSPSSRRAWVEMPMRLYKPGRSSVALLTEGVGRNLCVAGKDPQAGRVALLTEGVGRNNRQDGAVKRISSRPPHGGRG